jgi:uncharacterized repeat protein (TIGR03803 family)
MLAPGGTEKVLCRFKGRRDGGIPHAGLVADSVGNLYGTTEYDGVAGAGTLYKVSQHGKETVLYSFCANGPPACTDGANPVASLIDVGGTLYGTTANGGANSVGTVFKVTNL